MDVRPALPSDADAVFRLLRRFATSHEPARPAFDRNFPRLLGNEGTDLLVGEHSGPVVGYILASDSLTLFANGVVTEILELYVEKEHRGKGIGGELVRKAVARANDRSAMEVTVPTRRARSFYLALGFKFSLQT